MRDRLQDTHLRWLLSEHNDAVIQFHIIGHSTTGAHHRSIWQRPSEPSL